MFPYQSCKIASAISSVADNRQTRLRSRFPKRLIRRRPDKRAKSNRIDLSTPLSHLRPLNLKSLRRPRFPQPLLLHFSRTTRTLPQLDPISTPPLPRHRQQNPISRQRAHHNRNSRLALLHRLRNNQITLHIPVSQRKRQLRRILQYPHHNIHNYDREHSRNAPPLHRRHMHRLNKWQREHENHQIRRRMQREIERRLRQ